MWEFEIGRTLALLARTWRFILLRMLVYFVITLAYVLATGMGAGIGYGLGHALDGGDGPLTGAVWGGFAGFGLTAAIVYFLREYILYMVKAAHIAVLVELIDGRPIPDGGGQIAYGQRIVADRFIEANVLFVVDQLVKGAIRAVTGLIGGIASFIPGLGAIASIINGVIRVSLTYVDEIILGYNIRVRSRAPFETARHGVVLYAQNGGRMIKNAVWIAVILWGLTIIAYVVMLAPAAAVLYLMPGELAGFAVVLALVFAWAVKAALIEPFAITALMSVYFRVIEGQRPDPVWDERLASASRPFRDLVARGREAMPAPSFEAR